MDRGINYSPESWLKRKKKRKNEAQEREGERGGEEEVEVEEKRRIMLIKKRYKIEYIIVDKKQFLIDNKISNSR